MRSFLVRQIREQVQATQELLELHPEERERILARLGRTCLALAQPEARQEHIRVYQREYRQKRKK